MSNQPVNNQADSGDRGREPSPRRTQIWLPWAAVVALPILLWLALILLSLQDTSGYQPTGDALLDKYILTCERNLRDRIFSWKAAYQFPAKQRFGIEAFELQSWHEFEDDPRYWTLKAKQAWADIDAGYEILDPAYSALHAREAGMLSGALAYNYFLQLDEYWRRMSLQHISYSPETGSDWVAMMKAHREAMDTGPEAGNHRMWLDETLDKAADESTPYIILAFSEAERGNYDFAIEYLRQANAAPRNTVLAGFPNTELPLLLDSAEQGNQTYAFMVTASYIEPSLYRHMEMKQAFEALILAKVEAGDLPALAVIHEFAARYGLREGARTWDSSTCVNLMEEISSRLQRSYSGNLDTSAKTALSELDAKIVQLQSEYQAFNVKSSFPTPFAGKTGWQTFLLVIDALGTLGKSIEMEEIVNQNQRLLERQQVYEEKIYPLIRELQLFDFETLSFKDK